MVPLSTPTYLFVSAASANVTITLPVLVAPSATVGTNVNTIYIKRLDASTNLLTVTATTGQLIDDVLTFNIDSQFTAFSFVPNTTDLTWGIF